MATVELARANLKPWGPRVGAEAGAITVAARELAAAARGERGARGRAMLDKLEAILDDAHASAMARVRAAEIILDRGYGKAADSLALQLAEEASAASVDLTVTFRMGDRSPAPAFDVVDVGPVQREAAADAARPLELDAGA